MAEIKNNSGFTPPAGIAIANGVMPQGELHPSIRSSTPTTEDQALEQTRIGAPEDTSVAEAVSQQAVHPMLPVEHSTAPRMAAQHRSDTTVDASPKETSAAGWLVPAPDKKSSRISFDGAWTDTVLALHNSTIVANTHSF